MRFILAVLGLIILFPVYSFASETVKAIEVTGNHRVDYQTILLYAKVAAGDEVSDNEINKIIKSLHSTSLFSNIDVSIRKGILTIRVKENPIVNNVIIKGNHVFSDNELKKSVIRTQSLSVLSNSKLHSDLVSVTSLYRNSGRMGVNVGKEIIDLPDNRVDIVYRISEGEVAKIRAINFIGNKVFAADVLRNVISSHKYSFDKMFSKSTHYIPDQVLLDKSLLMRFYATQGYTNFTVKSFVSEISDNFGGVYLNFVCDEGEQKHFGSSVIILEDSNPDLLQSLEKLIVTVEGNHFDIEKVNLSIEKMTSLLNDRGNFFAKVEPSYNEHDNIVDISYKITTGSKTYVNRINLQGNTRTHDHVIRRELDLIEGDAYNSTVVLKSRRNIIHLGFFDAVDIETERLTDELVDLNLLIKERRTGSFKFGVGYSTDSGLMGDIAIKESNLMGTGRELSFIMQRSAIALSSSVDITEPKFLDYDLALGLRLFYSKKEQYVNSSFSSKDAGFVTRLGYDLTDNLQHSVRYSYKYVDVSDVKDNASIFIKEQEGKNTDSSIGHTLSYSKLDNSVIPKDGYLLRLSQDLAGIGGTLHYVKTEASAMYFTSMLKSLSDDIVFRFKMGMGYILGYNNEQVGIGQRFFIGMDEIRGFDLAGIGPRDAKTGDPLGGKFYFTQVAQIDFPIGLPQDIDIKGSLFLDFATLYGLDYPDKTYLESHLLRVSAGFGFTWASSFGPMRIDFGYPIVYESYDKTRVVRFSFGAGF